MTQQLQAFPERRKSTRRPVCIAAFLRCHRLRRSAVIVDCSVGGLRIDSNGAVTIGERVVVELLCGHRLPAQVMWVVGTQIGVRFLGTIQDGHPAQLALWEAVRKYKRRHPAELVA